MIDTNVIIEFQEKALPERAQSIISKVLDEEFNLSIINKIELLGYKYVTIETTEFVGLATVFQLDEVIAQVAIEIRKAHKIKLPDAIIAATALVCGFVIITRNVKDFENISELETINPYLLSSENT